MQEATSKSHKNLLLNTLAFTVCFAAWMVNGVLVTFLVTHQVLDLDPVEIGMLMGIPVLSGSLMRLPAGILTDRYGGKPVFVAVLLLCAVPMFLLSQVDSFAGFALCSLGFGMVGASFAVGVGSSVLWYPKHKQGTVLGIFGAGNAGAALTALLAPGLLVRLTEDGANLDGWRNVPKIYAALLVAMAVVMAVFSNNKRDGKRQRELRSTLAPLKNIRVWRFGLYYFLFFGCFVAFSQWLLQYFAHVYYMSLVTAGLLTGLFCLASGIVRAVGGMMSDRHGARRVMYWVLSLSCLVSLFVIIPKMEILAPGRSVMAETGGMVTQVSSTSIKLDDKIYELTARPQSLSDIESETLVWPTKETWHQADVVVGQFVTKNQLLAKGVTRVLFQANVWVFAFLVIVLGCVWGVGMAAVYKHIPDYFPNDVAVVGGMVGVLGGLGGFVCPILFGYLLKTTGLWTSCWMFLCLLSVFCLVWMHRTVQRMITKAAPDVTQRFEEIGPVTLSAD